jgi:hypothetical protein
VGKETVIDGNRARSLDRDRGGMVRSCNTGDSDLGSIRVTHTGRQAMAPNWIHYFYLAPEVKFASGEPAYASHFFKRFLRFDCDFFYPEQEDKEAPLKSGVEYGGIEVTADEAERFGLQAGSILVIWEDYKGYVHTRAGFASLDAAESWTTEHFNGRGE